MKLTNKYLTIAFSLGASVTSCQNSVGKYEMIGSFQSNNYDTIPGEFRCPITQELFQDPVMTCDGQTYERSAITDWLKNHNTSPVTNKNLSSKTLTSNYAMKSTLDAYKKKRDEYKALQKKVSEIEKKVIEKKKMKSCCFENFNEFDNNAKKIFAEQLKNASDVWNASSDQERLAILNKVGLANKGYSFLRIEFRQYLSAITQATRHTIDIGSGKHPSTEDFWNRNPGLHAEWILEFGAMQVTV